MQILGSGLDGEGPSPGTGMSGEDAITGLELSFYLDIFQVPTRVCDLHLLCCAPEKVPALAAPGMNETTGCPCGLG